MTGGE